jgi:hypothetical protein
MSCGSWICAVSSTARFKFLSESYALELLFLIMMQFYLIIDIVCITISVNSSLVVAMKLKILRAASLLLLHFL